MKSAIRTVLAGLLVGLSAVAGAEVPAALNIAAAPKTQAPAQAGSRQGEARRKALLNAIEDWKTFLPDNPQDPMTIKHSESLHAIKVGAAALKPGEEITPLEMRFEEWKQALLGDLYQQNQDRFFSDPQRFQQYMQERLDALTAIRDQKRRVPQQSKKLDELRAQIDGIPDATTLGRLYEKARQGSAPVSVSQVRTVSFSGPKAQANAAVYTTKSTFISPDQIAAPPAQFEPASYSPAHAGASTLSGIISSVSNTAKRYAGQVADAIVGFSRKVGIDSGLEAAFVWAESAFNPHATSGSGAMGLGQLMPGTAQGLGVSNAYDINQNVRGSTVFVKQLLNHFATADDIRYTEGLYAAAKMRVQSGQSADSVWQDVFNKTPLGLKNAIAAYNAGQGAIDSYAHGDYRQLPVRHTAQAEREGRGYWQTIHYVPTVLRHYFDITLKTPASSAPSFPSSFSV
jgi:soluble lytic murein transglycosylase-like protein